MTAGIITATAGELVEERASAARHIVVEAALLGVMADAVLRNAPGGLGWTLWVMALSLAALSLARHRGLGVSLEQMAWLGVGVLCAAAFSWRDSEELQAFNVVGTLVAITMFAMSAAGLPAPSVFAARLRDVITAGVYTALDIIGGSLLLLLGDANLSSLPFVRGGASWTMLRALLLTAPVVIVFAALLSRADPVFASAFQLPTIDVQQIVGHILLAGVFTWMSAGWMRGALLGVSQRAPLPEQLPLRLGLVEVTASLGAVIALFAVFVALQVRWLFGGAEVVLATTGLTVAEYARRGFFELVQVATLVLPLILVTRAAIDDEKVMRRHRQFSSVLLALLAAIMASALLRMQLYVSYFGLTTDRLYATAFMLWLGVVFVAMALTVLRGWSRPFAAMTAMSGFVMLFALNAVNPDALVARVNLSRSVTTRVVDYEYLARLSGDATPMVVNALRSATPSTESCKAVRSLRTRWLGDDVAWNLGAQRGRAQVTDGLSPASVLRLCAGVR